MRPIMIPTDFSHASLNAARYGVALAKAIHQKVVLFNACQPMPLPAVGIPVLIEADNIREMSMNDLRQLAFNLGSSSQDKIEVDCLQGPTVSTILEKVRDCNAQLIITGVKPHHTRMKFFGSTVTGLLRHTDVPMIVVPQTASYKSIKTIALAFETDANFNVNPRMLDSFIAIATHFHAQVYVVRVADKKIRDSFEYIKNPYRLMGMMRSINPVVSQINASRVDDGLNDFVISHHVDMLAVLPHEHSLLELLVKTSTTERLIAATSIPLLLLPALPPVNISLVRDASEAVM